MIDRVISEVRPYTGTPAEAITLTCERVLAAIDADVPGDLVECGTWLGGCSFAMLLAQKYTYGEIKRPVWMYDSFEGMSPPSPMDGKHAAGWWQGAEHLPRDKADMEYCIAPHRQVVEAAQALGLSDHVVIRKGWLNETLTQKRPDKVAVLRIDCDWYEPVTMSLRMLMPRVSEGGSVIIDDYYAWEGATLAVHKYLDFQRMPYPIKSVPGFHGAWFTKGPLKW